MARTTAEFIELANKIHNNLYDYSKTVYTNNHAYVTIIDPDYGEFTQKAFSHLAGQGNSKRAGVCKKYT